MEEVDRISELPESILHHILYLIPFKQVAQTSVLSKTWEKIWRTYPILEFDGTILSRTLCSLPKNEEDRKKVGKNRKRLFKGLEDALRDRYCREMISMQNFTLQTEWYDDNEFTAFVDRCICYAVGSGVKELILKFTCQWNKWYKLPQIVLRAGSMELLMLRYCLLDSPRSNMQLSSLRKLSLSHVFLDDHMIATLVSSCPLIERLYIHFCQGFKNLELSSLNKLDEVQVEYNKQLEQLNLDKLNIHSLTITSPAICEINASSCQNIKNLSLESISMKDELLDNLISGLTLLESLSLSDCYGLQSVNISSPYLEFLSLSDCDKLHSVNISSPCLKELCLIACSKLVELNIDAPNLSVFLYSGDLLYLSLNALSLSRIDLDLQDTGLIDRWFETCVELLAEFWQFCEVLSLRVTIEKNINVPRYWRIEVPSPLFSLKHLHSWSKKTSKIANLVDHLLWISPHTKTISIEYNEQRISSFEFVYKKELIYVGEFASCCKCNPISCWQQCIEEVKLEIIIYNDRSEKNVSSYTLKGANIMKQINALCGRQLLAKVA